MIYKKFINNAIQWQFWNGGNKWVNRIMHGIPQIYNTQPIPGYPIYNIVIVGISQGSGYN